MRNEKQFYCQRAFRERPDLAEHLIRGILSKPDLNVVKMNTQASRFAMNTKEGVREMTGVMEQIVNECLLKGKKQGLRQGMKKGIASRNAEIIENMSTLGFSIEQIVQVTGLSVKEVTEIAKGIKN